MTSRSSVTREYIETEYNVLHGIIRSPGKFEGEPVYVPAFWQNGLDGFVDHDDGTWFMFIINDEDRDIWPELGDICELWLREDEQGFVRSDPVRDG